MHTQKFLKYDKRIFNVIYVGKEKNNKKCASILHFIIFCSWFFVPTGILEYKAKIRNRPYKRIFLLFLIAYHKIVLLLLTVFLHQLYLNEHHLLHIFKLSDNPTEDSLKMGFASKLRFKLYNYLYIWSILGIIVWLLRGIEGKGKKYQII